MRPMMRVSQWYLPAFVIFVTKWSYLIPKTQALNAMYIPVPVIIEGT